jgi:hypothetical protein
VSEFEDLRPVEPENIWDRAHQQERADRIRRFPARMPDARADSAAARGTATAIDAQADAADCGHAMFHEGCGSCAVQSARRTASGDPLDPANLPPGVLLLTGPEAERYRALQAAARAARETAAAAQAAGAALRDAFQAFCLSAEGG